MTESALVRYHTLDRVQFRRIGWQRQQGDVVRHMKCGLAVPACLVQQQHRVHARRQALGEAGEEQVHRHGLRCGQHEGEGVVAAGANGGENVGREKALVAASGWALAAGEPAMTGAAFLALAGLIFTPDLDHLARMSGSDACQLAGEVFWIARAPRRCPWDGRAWPSARTAPCDAAAARGRTACSRHPSAASTWTAMLSRPEPLSPSTSGSGPCSTQARSSSCRPASSFPRRPDRGRSRSPVRPSALCAATAPRNDCRSRPTSLAASARLVPSSACVIASARSAARRSGSVCANLSQCRRVQVGPDHQPSCSHRRLRVRRLGRESQPGSMGHHIKS